MSESLAAFAASAANRLQFIFRRDLCVVKNTSQAASVEFVCCYEQIMRKAACKKPAEKPEGIFDTPNGLRMTEGSSCLGRI
ncbi:MAG: hypothetical protein ACI3V0_05430 [Faecousia sp.]